MASTPKITVTIDDQPLKWLEYTRDEPDGDGGATVTIRFARPDYEIQTTSHVVIREGHARGRAGMTVVFDTSVMERSQYSIEPIESGGDTLTITFRSRLNDKRDLAPREETEYFYPKKGGLRALMRFVGGKIGYSDVRTNIPNISLPSRVPFTCKESYWETMMRFVEPMRPLVLPDEGRGILYVWSLDVAIPGQPYRLPINRSEAVSIPKQVRTYVNQALIRWLPSGEDGQHWIAWGNDPPQGFDCTGATNQYSDPSGDLIATTRQLCGAPVDLSTDPSATLEEREMGEEAPDQDETGAVRVLRHEVHAVWRNPDTGEIDDDVLVSQTITAYGADGTTRTNPLYRTETKVLYVPGTDYKFSSGHVANTEGYTDIPGWGRVWMLDLYSETESIVYGLYRSKPGQFFKLYSTKQTRGRILYPDRVALWQGANNRTVNTAASSDQWTAVGPITWEMSSLAPAGTTSFKTCRKGWNYLTRRPLVFPTDDVLGHYPTEEAQKTEPIEELVQDEASIDDPAIGPRTAITIDATWVGTDVEQLGGEADRTIGREWAIEMALAMFRRSGKRIVTYNSTQAKLLTKLHRGATVRATRRDGANPHDYVVTGFRTRGAITSTDDFVYQTELVGRRLERGTEDIDPPPPGEATGAPVGFGSMIWTRWDGYGG